MVVELPRASPPPRRQPTPVRRIGRGVNLARFLLELAPLT